MENVKMRIVHTILLLTVLLLITTSIASAAVQQSSITIPPYSWTYNSKTCSYGFYNITVNGYSYSSNSYLELYRTSILGSNPRLTGFKVYSYNEDEITVPNIKYYYALYNSASWSQTVTFTVTQTMESVSSVNEMSDSIPAGQVKLFQCTGCLYSTDTYAELLIRRRSSYSSFNVDLAFSTKYPTDPNSIYSYVYRSSNIYVSNSYYYSSTSERYIGSDYSSRTLYIYVKCQSTLTCYFELTLKSSSYSSGGGSLSPSSAESMVWTIIGSVIGVVACILILAITITLSICARRRRRLYLLSTTGNPNVATVVATTAMEERTTGTTTYVQPPPTTMPVVSTTYVQPPQPPSQPMIQAGVVLPPGNASSGAFYPPQQAPQQPGYGMYYPNPQIPLNVQAGGGTGVYYQPPPSIPSSNAVVNMNATTNMETQNYPTTTNGGGIYVPPSHSNQNDGPIPAFNPNADKV
ncbi:hypothetical protein FDP41_012821 [Naegleria fowleri]|uniref:Uncharacterized protein n=1 Tax=Naegleria fowleri TaxID=5763 RepID=A0A6A5BSJ8_NAEFO|nr:uncharacterized protein FDP41_012821 [Naegleria fowleri]KAF0981033.1 hypothetical protein FDP41_012821 [Naegleria fowleri]CAG4711841.1 unnamed protein product [Naegleria fowleri]